jgi:hypothetical protein
VRGHEPAAADQLTPKEPGRNICRRPDSKAEWVALASDALCAVLWRNHWRPQQRFGAVELYTNESSRRTKGSGCKETLQVCCGKVRSWQVSGFEEPYCCGE